jgi:NO-binding membrane sensor protein with MHYT domain
VYVVPWLNRRVVDVQTFAHGWINPALAFVTSLLGWLLGLALVHRARQSTGGSRARWFVVAAVAIGGIGIWLMHFMAMLGFDVSGAVIRYDVPMTAASLGIAVTAVALGLFVVGFGRLSVLRVFFGALVTGVGVAATHYAGVAAVRLAGQLSVEPRAMLVSAVVAFAGSALALWFAMANHGGALTFFAAVLIASVACTMHYIAITAVRVDLTGTSPAGGVSPFVLLTPVSLLACVVVAALAYVTVGTPVELESPVELASSAADVFPREAGPGGHPEYGHVYAGRYQPMLDPVRGDRFA